MNGLEPAGIFPRLYAWIIDRLLVGSLWVLLACWGIVAYLSWTRWPPDLLDLAALVGIVLLWGIALHAAYFVVFVGGCGQTPGKMLCGIAVVRWDGTPPGYGPALLRWVGSVIAALPLWLGFLGVLFTSGEVSTTGSRGRALFGGGLAPPCRCLPHTGLCGRSPRSKRRNDGRYFTLRASASEEVGGSRGWRAARRSVIAGWVANMPPCSFIFPFRASAA